MNDEFGEEKMPYEEDQIRQRYKELYHECLRKFDLMTKEFAEVSQMIDLRSEIVDKMESEFDSKVQLNNDLSENLCKKLVNELFNSLSCNN